MLAALALLLAADTVKYVPRHEELKYTFGGHPPVLHLKPGTRLVSWTEDCFDGAVKTATDLPSRVMPPETVCHCATPDAGTFGTTATDKPSAR